MMTTGELERKIIKMFEERLPECKIAKEVHFAEGKRRRSLPGTYLFTKKDKYHCVVIGDRGDICEEFSTTDFDDILYATLEDGYIYRKAREYAKQSKKKCMDLRRLWFQKEVELYGLFSKNAEERKRQEYTEFIRRAPYNDLPSFPSFPVKKFEGQNGKYYSIVGLFRELEGEVNFDGEGNVKFYFITADEEVSLKFNFHELLRTDVGERGIEGVFGDEEKVTLLYQEDVIYIYTPDLQKYLDRVWERHPEGLFFPNK